MSSNKVFSILSLSTLIVFVLSAVLTVPALADSGTTPPPTGTTSGGRNSNKGSSSNSLSQVPSGTKIVVMDASGNKLPLGSQAAQDIVNSGDPIWCPSSVAMPIANVSGCSPVTYNTNLYTLTHAIQTGAWVPTLTNSTIWIMQGADTSGSQIALNVFTMVGSITNIANYTLTFAGGWTGSGHSVNTSTPSVVNGVGFSIAWNKSVTMSNIVDENAPSGQDGIYIYSTKAITLTNVQANTGHYTGVWLNDQNGSGVTITNSTFDGNDIADDGDYGLYVASAGPVTLTDTTVNDNYENGAYIDTADYGTAAVTLKGTNIFDSNGAVSGYGLDLYSKGAITSSSLDANDNSGWGAV